jgi:hypothetical protein
MLGEMAFQRASGAGDIKLEARRGHFSIRVIPITARLPRPGGFNQDPISAPVQSFDA